MPGKLNIFNLGQVGVNNTTSPLHGDDGALASAQNAVPDIRGEAGGLTKRDGLIAINASSAGGGVKGAVHVPLPTTRTTWLGKDGGSSGAGGWYSSTTSFTTTATVTSNGAPANPRDNNIQLSTFYESATVPSMTDTMRENVAVVVANRLYYIQDWFTNGYSAIRVFDGILDRLLCRIPINPDVGTEALDCLCLIADSTYLYLSVWDVGTAFGTVKGSVYRIDTVTGAIIKLGATFPTGYAPHTLCWHMGRLWAGTYSIDKSKSGRVYFIRPGVDTTWTLDFTSVAGQGEITSLASYNGRLFAGTRGSNTVASLILVRSTAGAWTTSLTAGTTPRDAWYAWLRVFSGKLYAAFTDYTNGTWLVTRYNDTSWSTVDSGSGQKVNLAIFDDGATIYTVDVSNPAGGASLVFKSSTDGSSWTSRIGNLTSAVRCPAFGVLVS